MIHYLQSKYSHTSLGHICELFGCSRQAYYQANKAQQKQQLEQGLVLAKVQQIRSLHKKMGTRKLYHKLQSFLEEHNIKIGRDGLFKLLNNNGLLIRKRKKRVRTTFSYAWFKRYPNLTTTLDITSVNQLWVADITYLRTRFGFLYIHLITDAYSHKIVGYNIADSLQAVETRKALKMAVASLYFLQNKSRIVLVHHSDRGLQYYSEIYTKLLKEKKIQISMTQSGDPLENPIAERINGILKQEYMDTYTIKDLTDAKDKLDHAINLYNTDRPHLSIGMNTPEQVHQNPNIEFKKLWKNYYNKSIPVNLF